MNYVRSKNENSNSFFLLGVAFNPYLPDSMFEEELSRLEHKLNTCVVKSVWLQFGTDYELLMHRIQLIKGIISRYNINNEISNTLIYGSVLIPSKKFLSRFKFRPWKGVYCCDNFLESVDYAIDIVSNLLMVYKKNNILPIIETSTSTDKEIVNLNTFFNIQ